VAKRQTGAEIRDEYVVLMGEPLLVSRDVVYEKVESRAAGADGCEP